MKINQNLINDVKSYLEDQEPRLPKGFDYKKLIERTTINNFVDQEDATSIICNLEGPDVFKELIMENYEVVDVNDSGQFNDSYEDMYDDIFGEEDEE